MGAATYMFLVKILFIQNIDSECEQKAKEIGLLTFEKYSNNYFIIAEKWEEVLAQARAIGDGYSRDHLNYLNSVLDVEPEFISRASVHYDITSIENLGGADPERPVFIVKK